MRGSGRTTKQSLKKYTVLNESALDATVIADFVDQINNDVSKTECRPDIYNRVNEFLRLVYTTDINGRDLLALATKVALEQNGGVRPKKGRLLPFDRSNTRMADLQFSNLPVSDGACKGECYTILWRIAFDGCKLLPGLIEELKLLQGTDVPKIGRHVRQINSLVGDQLESIEKRMSRSSVIATFIVHHPELKKMKAGWKNRFYLNLKRLMALVDYMHLPGVDQQSIIKAMRLEGVLNKGDNKHTVKRRKGARIEGKRPVGKTGIPRAYRVLWAIVDRYWGDLELINNYLYEIIAPGLTTTQLAALPPAATETPPRIVPVYLGSGVDSSYIAGDQAPPSVGNNAPPLPAQPADRPMYLAGNPPPLPARPADRPMYSAGNPPPLPARPAGQVGPTLRRFPNIKSEA